ncbi:MAG: class I tRNA ligase family protein, partial [bacterium]|nr:class I tRNA ligase family protein [bacterium]
MTSYNPQDFEKKWQDYWDKIGVYQAEDFSTKPKKYILVEFPYPSGDGLHVGHVRSYSALDTVARKKRMEGFNVLYPMGWDAFGLPTENYAIRKGIHPQIATATNIGTFKRQIKSLGLSFDWSREINTTDPQYYSWTQWIFLKLFGHGLAYQAKIPINWCPSCKIGLANEEVVVGNCERCGAKTERREIKQWLLRITKYADRLLNDLTT